MPTIESFMIDHTKIKAPSLRLVKTINTPKGDYLYVFDLRFCVPNIEKMAVKGMHTLEHLFASYLRKYIDQDKIYTNYVTKYIYRKLIDISPMGCRTGFYLILLSDVLEIVLFINLIIDSWKKSMLDISKLTYNQEIPGANIYQCGSYLLHSLSEAQDIVNVILMKKILILKNEDITFTIPN